MVWGDFTGFHALGEDLLERLGSRLEPDARTEVAEYIEYGEEGLAADLLAGLLVHHGVPISVEERDMLTRLLDYFPRTGSEESVRTYGWIYNRDRTLTRLNVVES